MGLLPITTSLAVTRAATKFLGLSSDADERPATTDVEPWVDLSQSTWDIHDTVLKPLLGDGGSASS